MLTGFGTGDAFNALLLQLEQSKRSSFDNNERHSYGVRTVVKLSGCLEWRHNDVVGLKGRRDPTRVPYLALILQLSTSCLHANINGASDSIFL